MSVVKEKHRYGVDCCIVVEVIVVRFGSGGLCVYPGMGMRVFYPRFAVGRLAPSAMLLMDSFAYLRASWGRECYVQQVLEHLFFSGLCGGGSGRRDSGSRGLWSHV